MRRVKFKESIEAHPHGHRQVFTKGDEVDVSEAFANLVVEKGHATFVDGKEGDERSGERSKAEGPTEQAIDEVQDLPRRRGRPPKERNE